MGCHIKLQRPFYLTIITRTVLVRAQLDPVAVVVTASDRSGRFTSRAELAINSFRPLVAT